MSGTHVRRRHHAGWYRRVDFGSDLSENVAVSATPAARPAARPVGASPLGRRLIVAPVDLFLVAALVTTTLNSQGALGFMASPAIKSATALAAAAVAVLLLVRYRARPQAPAVIVLFAVLVSVLMVTSLVRQLPTQRNLLLLQFLAVAFCLVVWMCVRPGRVLGVLFTSAIVHLVLAKVFPTQVLWVDGQYRLGGGSHPIQLGFEASAVIVVSLLAAAHARVRTQRIVYALIGVYAVYILLQAFSRQSLIGVSAALVVMAFVIPGPFRWVRAFCSVVGAVLIVVSLGGDGIASLLGAGSVQDLSSATGRTDIWARIITYLPDFLPLGYGFAPLNDANGPDSVVYYASSGEPAENAFLEVLLEVGLVGALVWAALIVACIREIVRSRGDAAAVGLAFIPIFASSVLVNTGLASGLQLFWLLAVVTECAAVRRLSTSSPRRVLALPPPVAGAGLESVER